MTTYYIKNDRQEEQTTTNFITALKIVHESLQKNKSKKLIIYSKSEKNVISKKHTKRKHTTLPVQFNTNPAFLNNDDDLRSKKIQPSHSSRMPVQIIQQKKEAPKQEIKGLILQKGGEEYLAKIILIMEKIAFLKEEMHRKNQLPSFLHNDFYVERKLLPNPGNDTLFSQMEACFLQLKNYFNKQYNAYDFIGAFTESPKMLDALYEHLNKPSEQLLAVETKNWSDRIAETTEEEKKENQTRDEKMLIKSILEAVVLYVVNNENVLSAVHNVANKDNLPPEDDVERSDSDDSDGEHTPRSIQSNRIDITPFRKAAITYVETIIIKNGNIYPDHYALFKSDLIDENEKICLSQKQLSELKRLPLDRLSLKELFTKTTLISTKLYQPLVNILSTALPNIFDRQESKQSVINLFEKNLTEPRSKIEVKNNIEAKNNIEEIAHLFKSDHTKIVPIMLMNQLMIISRSKKLINKKKELSIEVVNHILPQMQSVHSILMLHDLLKAKDLKHPFAYLRKEQGYFFSFFQSHGNTRTWQMIIEKVQEHLLKAYEIESKNTAFKLNAEEQKKYNELMNEKAARSAPFYNTLPVVVPTSSTPIFSH